MAHVRKAVAARPDFDPPAAPLQMTSAGAPREAPTRVLLIDPDPAAPTSAAIHMLRQNGMALEYVGSAEHAARTLAPHAYHLVILELASDSYDGVELCRRIIERERAPVLIWSRQASPLDQVAGLELGAEDFVAKTAHPLELLARCRAILRRAHTPEERTGEPGHLGPYAWAFEPRANGVRSWRGARVWLRPTCSVLLGMLCAAPRKVVTRSQMLARISRDDREIGVRTVDVMVSRLRRSLEDCDRGGYLIRTLQSQGYFLNADVQAADGGLIIRGEPPAESD